MNITLNTSVTNASFERGYDDLVIQDLSIDFDKEIEREQINNSLKGAALRGSVENLSKTINRLSNYITRMITKDMKSDKSKARMKMKRLFLILQHYLTFKEVLNEY